MAPVMTSSRTRLNVEKMRVVGCRWTDVDAVKGQRPLAAREAVGKVVTVVTELGE